MTLAPTFQPTHTTATLKELFWRQGYENASIADVVQATGKNRYALYNAFGGKRELFLAALDDYYHERKAVFLAYLNDPQTPPLNAIRRVIEFAIAEMVDRGAGCLLGNVANEMGPKDCVIATRVETYLHEIEFAYCEALARADARGELNSNVSPVNGAKMLIAVQLGLGVRAQAGANGGEMLEIFNAAMQAIAGPRECAQQ